VVVLGCWPGVVTTPHNTGMARSLVVDTSVVTPDQVSLGVLVAAVPRDAVDDAVAVCGVGAKRSDGKLPPHVVAYLTMALCLFTEDDYTEVATKVTGSLDRWGCWDATWTVLTASAITQARKRLGRHVFPEIFQRTCGPVAGDACRSRVCWRQVGRGVRGCGTRSMKRWLVRWPYCVLGRPLMGRVFDWVGGDGWF
jgi:transposase IS4-like protein